MQQRQNKIKSEINTTVRSDKTKVAEVVAVYENKLKDLEYKLNEQQTITEKSQEMERLQRDHYEDEIFRLKGDLYRV